MQAHGGASHHPLLCVPEQKAEIEAANGVEQIEYVSDVVHRGVAELTERHVLDLHRLAVQNIYPCAGNYRRGAVTVSDHKPPVWTVVPSFTRDAIDWINNTRKQRTRSALERAAFALWRFNWIHPFFGGNGRTSRALAYLIICQDNGAMLPGNPSMPSRIKDRRKDYVAALKEADRSVPLVGDDEDADFSTMTKLLQDILTEQLAAVIDGLSSSRKPSQPPP